MLVKERDQRPAEGLVRGVDQLLAGVVVLLDGNGLPYQRDDVRAARQRQASGAPQETQRGAGSAGELPRAREGQELGGPEVVDGNEI